MNREDEMMAHFESVTNIRYTNTDKALMTAAMEWADSHPINQWHKVEDELPPRIRETVNVSKTVIVSNGLSYGLGYYNYNLNKWFCVGTTNITHWMELSELPKKEE